MKKIFLSVCTTFLLFCSSSFVFALSDIEGHENETAIAVMNQKGILTGYPDDRFRADKTINRAELIKIVVASKGVQPNNSEYRDCFPDVQTEWFAPHICYAKKQGWVKGYSDGNFRPAQAVDFVEAAKIITESFGFAKNPNNENWYTIYILILEAQNAIPMTVQKLSSPFTRAQAAEVLYRLIEGIQSKPTLSYEELRARQIFSDDLERAVLNSKEKIKHNKKNPIFIAEAKMLQHKTVQISSQYRYFSESGLSYELSGGLPLHNSIFEDELRTLTGETAISETLQLGSIQGGTFGETQDSSHSLTIKSVDPVDIPSLPWAEMLRGKTFDIPSIAKLAPKDMLFLHFQDTKKLAELEAALIKSATSFVDIYSFGNESQRREEMWQKLGISGVEALQDVEQGVFLSHDLSLIPGTDYALILQTNDAEKLEISSDVPSAEIDGYTVVATHSSLIQEIQEVANNAELSLANQQDFHFALSEIEDTYAGMTYMSEAFIRKMTGPAYRINAERRASVMNALETLQYTVFAYRRITGVWPNSFEQMSSERYIARNKIFQPEKYTIDPQGRVQHEDWGSIWDIRPINRVDIQRISALEKSEYERFSQRYQGIFRNFFDPVTIVFDINEYITIRTLVLPLVENSEYNWLKVVTGSLSDLSFFSDPERAGAISISMALSMDNILEEIGSQMPRATEKAYDAVRLADISTLKTALALFKADIGTYPDSLTPLGGNYVYSIPRDPQTEELYDYQFISIDCYRLAAQLTTTENAQRMGNDGGIDPYLYEVGECKNQWNFPIASAPIYEENTHLSTAEIRQQNIQVAEKAIASNFDFEIPEGERLLDFFGTEVTFAVGPRNDFQDLRNIDAWLGVKVMNEEKAKRFLELVMNQLLPSDSPIASQDAIRVSDLSLLKTALELYKNDNGNVPDTLNSLQGFYIGSIPTDPATDLEYAYEKISDTCFRLFTHLYAPSNASRMKSDGGIDPLLLEQGTCPEQWNFPLVSTADYESGTEETAETPAYSYGDTEYSTFPVDGLFFQINIYSVFLDDIWYLTLSKKGVENLIDAHQDGTEQLPSHVTSHTKNIGSRHNIAAFFDLKALSEWMFIDNQELNTHRQISRALEKRIQYLFEVLSLAEILPNFDGTLRNAMTYYTHIPKTFLDGTFSITGGRIFLEANEKRIPILLTVENLPRDLAQELSSMLNSEELRNNIAYYMKSFQALAIGLSFTENGLESKVSIGKP